MENKLRYAIVGLGFIYPRHKQSIERTGGEIVLTCDIDITKTPDHTDWVAMMHDPKFNEVDAVVICTPNYLHSAIAREALLRGKKVLCEKPLTIDGFQGLEGVKAVLQLRESPEVNRVKVKKPVRVDMDITMFRDASYFSGWKGNVFQSGGLLFNLGVHYLDLLIYLLGNPVEIKRSNSHIIAHDNHWEEDHELEVIFENGVGTMDIQLIQNGLYPEEKPSRKMVVTYEDGTKENLELSNKENLSYEDLHLEVYKKFIKGEGVPLEEAKKALQLAHDLYKKNDGK